MTDSPQPGQSKRPLCEKCEAALESVGGEREAIYPPTGPSAHIWHRIGMRERARVERVWTGYPPMRDPDKHHVAVRCQSLHGGRHWVACLCDFRERFARNAQDLAA